jgi:hypothetical protein
MATKLIALLRSRGKQTNANWPASNSLTKIAEMGSSCLMTAAPYLPRCGLNASVSFFEGGTLRHARAFTHGHRGVLRAAVTGGNE